MAVDASGTPTSPDSIPTYATSADAPSGKGFNAAMAAIQTALSGRWLKTLFTTTGDIAYASSASTPARLGIGSSGNVLTVAGGVPTWAAPTGSGSVTTTSAWSGGPPGSPTDKDIWIATGVDANGTRWAFQYNAGSVSAYKWEFVGGPPVRVTGGAVTLPLSAWTTVLSWTAGRGGDYHVTFGRFSGTNNAATSQTVNAGISGAGGAPADNVGTTFPADTAVHAIWHEGTALSVAAASTVTLMGDPATLQLNVSNSDMLVVPKRVI